MLDGIQYVLQAGLRVAGYYADVTDRLLALNPFT